MNLTIFYAQEEPGVTANIDADPPLYVETLRSIRSLTKSKFPDGCSETPKQRRRRQKKVKHKAAKLFRTLEGGPYMEARLIK